MKITLYNPATYYYTNYRYRAYPVLSLPILAAVLNKAGHEAEVVDLERMAKHPRDAFKPPWPDVIGFTCLTPAGKSIKDSIVILRSKGYTGRIIIGGIYPTMFPEDVETWGADLIVTGECEGNIVQLLESGVQGVHKGEAVPIEDVPIPDWEHHTPDISAYEGNMSFIMDRPAITMWSRGCPYACIFCENKIYQRRTPQYRPPENIQAEMMVLRERNRRDIFIYDDELVGQKVPEGWMSDVADRIGSMGFNMVCHGRCNKRHITMEVMRDAKRAGINTVFWGVESFSPVVLEAIKKQETVADIWHSLRVSKEAGMDNGLYIITGSYKETPAEAEITRVSLEKACREGLVDYLQVFSMAVMPGTELEQIAKHEGWYKRQPKAWQTLKKVQGDGTPWMHKQQILDYQRAMKDTCPDRVDLNTRMVTV